MLRVLPSLLGAACLLAGGAGTALAAAPAPSAMSAAPARPAPPPNDDLDAVAWAQTAIEHNLVYLETYRDAQSRLLAALHDPHWDALPTDDRMAPLRGLKPAVVLDIDETVLDNSPYQARLVKHGGKYNETTWAAWCREEKARALPGAVAFTQFAAKHGIAVIFISNRDKSLDQVTLANLRKDGFPVAGPDAFLGMGTHVPGCKQIGDQKTCRRRLVSRRYRVLMQFGDQLGDFVDVPADTRTAQAQAVAPYLKWVGTRWFVLPNPTYGDWLQALSNNDGKATDSQRRQDILDAFHYQ